MRVAVDVMGGDHAPDAILKGCVQALADLSHDDELILVGPRELIEDYLTERDITDCRVVIEHAPDMIAMDESPAKAVRQKPDSSIVKMSWLGSQRSGRRADAVLSAGNTGACVSAAIMQMKRMPGCIRPGIAVTVPSFHGPVLMIDAGANPEPRPTHLAQYALMGDTMARVLHKIQSPRVAVMNIGSEEAKGTGLIKETRDLVRSLPGINYVGFVEGRDFFEGVADVVVTDGLVGNTLLKSAEGLAKSMFKAIIAELMEVDVSLIPPMEEVIRRIYRKNDYHELGGAPLLGVDGACFIAHGSSEPRTIRAAIRNARAFVGAGVNEAIVRRLAQAPEFVEAAGAE